MNNIIYGLISQQSILANENIMKVGKAYTLSQIKKYPNNTKFIVQLQCDNCDEIYDNLLEYLKTKYIYIFNTNKNYFQGDFKQLEIDIIMFVKRNEITQYLLNEQNKLLNEIYELFPNYKQDVLFGGDNILVRIDMDVDNIIVSYIISNENKYTISKTSFRKDLYCEYNFDFFTEIIKHKIIMNGCVYLLKELVQNLKPYYNQLPNLEININNALNNRSLIQHIFY